MFSALTKYGLSRSEIKLQKYANLNFSCPGSSISVLRVLQNKFSDDDNDGGHDDYDGNYGNFGVNDDKNY